MQSSDGGQASMSDCKYIPCTHCKNFAYCIDDGSFRFNTVDRPCVDAEPVDEET